MLLRTCVLPAVRVAVQVEALLDRAHGGPPPVSWVVQQLEQLGYNSWAHRIICSAGERQQGKPCVCVFVRSATSAELARQSCWLLLAFRQNPECSFCVCCVLFYTVTAMSLALTVYNSIQQTQ
jgi:hypothetical protein